MSENLKKKNLKGKDLEGKHFESEDLKKTEGELSEEDMLNASGGTSDTEITSDIEQGTEGPRGHRPDGEINRMRGTG